MRQAFVFLLMFMGACFSSFSADIKKASVISDGDRGLALEWVKDLDGDVCADKKKTLTSQSLLRLSLARCIREA